MFYECWANTQIFSGKYSYRQYIKIGKSFQNSNVSGEGAPVSGLTSKWPRTTLDWGMISPGADAVKNICLE